MNFAFGGRITLLHFRAARFDGRLGVRLGRTRCAAAAVAAGIAAQKHYNVAFDGLAPYYIFLFVAAYNIACFQPFCFVIGVVHLRHKSRGKTYLVAVAGISRRRSLGYHALGKFAGQSCGNALSGVGAARHAHRLVDVCPARKRIAYGSAQTSGGSAERLYLRGVVMRFVFEHYQPLFRFAVVVHVYFHRAGVDFVAYVQIIQLAARFQLFYGNGGYIHHAHILIRTGSVELLEQLFILVQRDAQMRIVAAYLYISKFRSESGVAAMVRPVGVYYL